MIYETLAALLTYPHDIVVFLHKFFLKHYTLLLDLSLIIVFIGILQNLIYVIQSSSVLVKLLQNKIRGKYEHTWWLRTSDIIKPISILIPCYNEGRNSIPTIDSAINFDYPDFEVIVINDGSTDNSMEIMKEEYDLFPSKRSYEYAIKCAEIIQIYKSYKYKNLIVVDKAKEGARADAINAGINISRNPVFCTLDADSIMDPDALLKIIECFIKDPKTIAAGGSVKILNGHSPYKGRFINMNIPNNIIILFQILEYTRSFFMNRIFLNNLKIVNLLSGTFSVIDRKAAILAGGFRTDSLGEDYDMTMKLHRYIIENKTNNKIYFIAEAICWTEAPETLKELKKQRVRWHQGALEVFFNNKDMLFNPYYKRIGMLAMPLSLLIDIISPIGEFLSYILIITSWAAHFINNNFYISFLILLLFLNFLISIVALLLDSLATKNIKSPDIIIKLGFCALIEMVFYKIIKNYWKILGWYYFITNKKTWSPIKRSSK